MLNKIRERAASKGVSLREIERKCGFPFGSIKRWDRIAPSVFKVKAVADVLGCTVDDLIGDEDAPDAASAEERGREKGMIVLKTLYECDPKKNKKCKKTNCFENGGPCYSTFDEECSNGYIVRESVPVHEKEK